jgi:molybdopterin-binding protein
MRRGYPGLHRERGRRRPRSRLVGGYTRLAASQRVKQTAGRQRLDVQSLAAGRRHMSDTSVKGDGMQLSARNQLNGTVKAITLGTVMSEVTVDVHGQELVAAITRGSVESLGLTEGDEIMVVIKATEVMLAKN